MKNIELKVVAKQCCGPKDCSVEPAETTKHEAEIANAELPVAIIGAGPIGLAAAAHLVNRKQKFILIEAGSQIAHSIRKWGHVRLFSPWQYNIDKTARTLLLKHGWNAPSSDVFSLGKELVEQYLKPLAELPKIKPHIMLDSQVIAVSRENIDKMKSTDREQSPFVLYIESEGSTKRILARAVIDSSGTWSNPNPLYASGVWTKEERSLQKHIVYGIPEFTEENKSRYEGKRVAVVGSGHSAINTLLDLVKLKESNSKTELLWIMRKRKVDEAYGGEENDQLEARGELGSRIHRLVNSGQIKVVTPLKIEKLSKIGEQLQIVGTVAGENLEIEGIDQIIVNTGSRPDFSFLREIRLSIDSATESVETLAPLIDPNIHSCGTVRPHGAKELQHHEKDFYIVGMKSYGRAPSFLMATGYEQVRSVVAYLTGDFEAAAKVELELPETGVCSVNARPVQAGAGESCCSTTSETASSSCCN
ncbi:NAD(P)-binding domain-containing protein [Paenibacillus sp. GbtcB18]|uniref:NAD(P)-binding domain-containing protein n=1 Tax=Paenibacillus sp. GbtcB18 TaxID=2824763 RepID=UPI001C3056D2|nr:NAD(P)-binding domain-containing protein [Paenibacillus sp. GbtcB18]